MGARAPDHGHRTNGFVRYLRLGKESVGGDNPENRGMAAFQNFRLESAGFGVDGFEGLEEEPAVQS